MEEQIIERPYYVTITSTDGHEERFGSYRDMDEYREGFRQALKVAKHNQIVAGYFEITRKQKRRGDVDHFIELIVKKEEQE